MTGLLASVASVAETHTALSGYADLVDCKDPRNGALGALPPETITAIVRAVDGQRPVSATTGDIASGTRDLRDAVSLTIDCGVDYVKIGLFDEREAVHQVDALRAEAGHQNLIAVCLADRFDPLDLLPRLRDCGFAGVMLDTADKTGRGLTDTWEPGRIAHFVSRARALGLLCGLAGRLQTQDIPALLPLGADYLGFRSALCPGGRAGPIDIALLMRLRAAIPFGDDTAPLPPPMAAAH